MACQSRVNKEYIIIPALEFIPEKTYRYSHICHHHRSTPLHHSNVVRKIKPHFYANIHGAVQGK
jgi:hypothetical protein